MNTLNNLLVEMQKSFEIPMENNPVELKEFLPEKIKNEPEMEKLLSKKIDIEFKEFLSKKLDKYYTFITDKKCQNFLIKIIKLDVQQKRSSFQNIDDFNNCIKVLIEGINQSLSDYYEGKPAKAYDHFKATLDGKDVKFEDIFPRLYTEFGHFGDVLYRTRKDEGKTFTKEDLFHIDFESRHLVNTARYSIPGFPALYLGSSSFVCWKEFNEYPFEKLWFSSFKLIPKENGSGYSVFSIDRIQDFLGASVFTTDNPECYRVVRYLAIFPLMIACSIKTKYDNKQFKAEYIIPQLLTQYIADDNSIDGIKYPSTKVDYSKLQGVSAYNFVFPPKIIKSAGHCDYLTRMFHMTEPTNLKIVELALNPSTTKLGRTSSEGGEQAKKIMLIEGCWDSYIDSSFEKIEKILKKSIVSRNSIISLVELEKFSDIYSKYPKYPFFGSAKALGNWSFVVTKQ